MERPEEGNGLATSAETGKVSLGHQMQGEGKEGHVSGDVLESSTNRKAEYWL